MKLLDNSFVVLRFWEREIHKSFKEVEERLMRVVGGMK
jgi:very-short-patch-repair endonuclease